MSIGVVGNIRILDEEIVDKVNLPGLKSSPIMEFADDAERDTYFTANPDSLFKGREIWVGSASQKYDGATWS